MGCCCFIVWGESPGCRLLGTDSMLGVVEKSPPPPFTGQQYRKMEPKYPRVVTARVFYVLRVFLTSPFILNNPVETAAPFNMVIHQ